MFLQPVFLPERCFLQEVLFWVAFQRLPAAWLRYDEEDDYREDERDGEYVPEGRYVDDSPDYDECERMGIPPCPTRIWLDADKSTLPPEHYDRPLAMPDGDPGVREQFEAERRDALEYQAAFSEWMPRYKSAIEYPASRIFVALREGRLKASGKLLPSRDVSSAFEVLERQQKDVGDLPNAAIPKDFWSLAGIRWESDAAENATDHYCWIRCQTEEMLSVFPGEHREAVHGVEHIGSTFIVPDVPVKRKAGSARPRGRPAYPWDQFHLEVADTVARHELPDKKEAAIQQFQDWFERAHRVRPSRAAIGEKLKPYYDRFVRPPDRK